MRTPSPALDLRPGAPLPCGDWPQEPSVYRLNEAIMHGGEAIKALINEQFGGGVPGLAGAARPPLPAGTPPAGGSPTPSRARRGKQRAGQAGQRALRVLGA